MSRKPTQKQLDGGPAILRGKYWLPNDAKWGGFLNLRLSDEQKAEFYARWEDDRSFWWPVIDDLCGFGAKVAVTYDGENQCYICTITGALVLGSNERYCTTTRAGTLDEVFALAAWKHELAPNGDYADFKPKSGTFKQWG